MMEAVYPAQIRMMNHWHARANFCIALAGTSTERYGTRVREFRPLTASFLPSEQMHSLTFHAEPMRCFTIDIAPESMERAREYSLVTNVSDHFNNDPLTEIFLKLYNQFRETDNASGLAIEGLLFEMLAVAFRWHTNDGDQLAPRWLTRVRDLLHAHFSEQLSFTRIAAEVGVHPVHLAREFRKHYRSSLGEYLRKVRVDYASRQLLISDESPALIAAAAGFADQSHFYRTFKRLRGTTPGKFRAAFKVSESGSNFSGPR
jgi:AraC family transcriptional regulator